MGEVLASYLSNEQESDYAQTLMTKGYAVIGGAMPIASVECLAADLSERFAASPFCDGDFYGRRTKRFGKLLTRSEHAEAFVMNKVVLALASHALSPHCDNFCLNLGQAIQIHPGALSQAPHRDQDMWGGEKGKIEYLVNVMWPLSSYRPENGATLIWEHSHGKFAGEPPTTKPIAISIDPGDALVFLGSTLHAGGANVSDEVRSGMIISYSLGWLKPYENQWLCYPPHVAKDFSPELAALIGYRQHRPNLGNVEGRCPSFLLGSSVPEFVAPVDCLAPTQAAALREFVEAQQAGQA